MAFTEEEVDGWFFGAVPQVAGDLEGRWVGGWMVGGEGGWVEEEKFGLNGMLWAGVMDGWEGGWVDDLPRKGVLPGRLER